MKIFVLTFFPDQHSEDKSVQLVRVSFVPKYLTSYKIHTLKKAGLADLILLIVATWSGKHFSIRSKIEDFKLVKNYELFYNQVLWALNCWVGSSNAPFSSRICSISSAASNPILFF